MYVQYGATLSFYNVAQQRHCTDCSVRGISKLHVFDMSFMNTFIRHVCIIFTPRAVRS